jgi:hypothetical protein
VTLVGTTVKPGRALAKDSELLKYMVSLKNGRAVVEAASTAEAAKLAKQQHGEKFVRVLGLMNGVGKDDTGGPPQPDEPSDPADPAPVPVGDDAFAELKKQHGTKYSDEVLKRAAESGREPWSIQPRRVEDEHLGFKKLEGQLAKEKGVTDPAALAASIGRKKYGAAGMAKKSAAGLAKDKELQPV